MTSKQNRGITEQMYSGLCLAAATLLAFGTMTLLLIGMGMVFFPTQINPLPLIARYSPAIGWWFLAASTTILMVTMKRWVLILPGLLAFALVRALPRLLTGDISNPAFAISRLEILAIIAFLAIAMVLVWRLSDRKLNLLDRSALLLFVYCLAWNVLSRSQTVRYGTLTMALVALLLAYSQHRIRRLVHSRREHTPNLTS